MHVDGAFGLWAAASPRHAHLVAGVAEADSWATDAHKWLNVPYDSGLAFVRDAEHLRGAMSLTAAYLPQGGHREPSQYVPELSRRARGVDTWAALKSLGRSGLAELIDRNCRCATRFADGLAGAGFEILNDVVLNQVLVSFGTPETTERVIAGLQEDGTCWCGPTLWQGRWRCGSASLPGRRRRRMSTAVWKPCCGSRGTPPGRTVRHHARITSQLLPWRTHSCVLRRSLHSTPLRPANGRQEADAAPRSARATSASQPMWGHSCVGA